MSRLIDADKLKEKKEYSQERHEYIVSVAQIDWQPTIQPQGIDKDRLIEELENLEDNKLMDIRAYSVMKHTLDLVKDIINQQPTTDGWIPVTYHEITEEEKEVYGNECPYILDCPMPDADTEILVCTKKGNVFVDTACYDWGWYLDGGFDFVEDIVAWQPLPQPYKESE